MRGYGYTTGYLVKSGFVITKKSGIIIGAMAFESNPYDGHTLLPQLDQVSDLLEKLPKIALVDKGYKGRKVILGVEIKMPGSGRAIRHMRKAGTEPALEEGQPRACDRASEK